MKLLMNKLETLSNSIQWSDGDSDQVVDEPLSIPVSFIGVWGEGRSACRYKTILVFSKEGACISHLFAY
jgi:hypothetical protein